MFAAGSMQDPVVLLLCHLGDKCIVCKLLVEGNKKVLLEGHPHNRDALLFQICGSLSQVGTHTCIQCRHIGICTHMIFQSVDSM